MIAKRLKKFMVLEYLILTLKITEDRNAPSSIRSFNTIEENEYIKNFLVEGEPFSISRGKKKDM